MLISVKSLGEFRVGTKDGLAGKLIDFNFDDRDWSVTHILAGNNPARRERSVLIDPGQIGRVDARENVAHTFFSKSEYDRLPAGNSVLPVCLQYEFSAGQRPSAGRDTSNPHLRCATAVTGYEIYDPSGRLGILRDFLIDTASWKIAFLVGSHATGDFLVDAWSVAQISFAGRRISIRENANWDLAFAQRSGYDNILEPA
jgi:hypothetical protein